MFKTALITLEGAMQTAEKSNQQSQAAIKAEQENNEKLIT